MQCPRYPVNATHDSCVHQNHPHSHGHHRSATHYQYTDDRACSGTHPPDKICFDLQRHSDKCELRCARFMQCIAELTIGEAHSQHISVDVHFSPVYTIQPVVKPDVKPV